MPDFCWHESGILLAKLAKVWQSWQKSSKKLLKTGYQGGAPPDKMRMWTHLRILPFPERKCWFSGKMPAFLTAKCQKMQKNASIIKNAGIGKNARDKQDKKRNAGKTQTKEEGGI